MDLKKIIKEEVGDFNWANEIEPYEYGLTDEEWSKLNSEVSELMMDPHIRIGQAYMIALGRVNKRIYNHVTGTNLDPWNGSVSYIKLIKFLRGDSEL